MADQEISVVITAKDEASPTIAALTKKVAKLEKDPATLLLTTNATKITKQMVDLLRQVDKLDASDPEITVKTSQINALQGDLNHIESKLREINQIPVGAGVNDLGRSAQSSRSALANMIGNSVQDLGALSGVAGSAGVAIGQMGEYMADAALDGEGFMSVLGNFAKVAGPIAAVSIGVGLISSALGNARKQAEESRKRVQEFTDALTESGIDALGIANQLRQTVVDQEGAFKGTLETLTALDNSYISIAAAADAATDAQTQFIDTAVAKFAAGIPIPKSADESELTQRQKKIDEFRGSVEKLFAEIAKAQDLEDIRLGMDADQFAVVVDALERAEDPLGKFPNLWRNVMDAIGSTDKKVLERGARAAEDLADLLGFENGDQVIAQAKEFMNDWGDIIADAVKDTRDQVKEQSLEMADALIGGIKEAIEANNRAVDDWVDKHRRFVRAMDEARRAAEEYADPVEAAARATQALNEAFAEHDSIISTWEQIVDVRDALRDLAEFIQRDMKGTIPNLLDPNDVNAGPYLDRFRAVRNAVQDRLTEVFSEGGPQAAKNWAERQITQIEKTLGGRLTRDQIRELLGWDDLEVTLQVAVDKKSAADAELLGKAVTAPLEVIGVTDAVDKARAEVAVATKQSPFEIPVKFTLSGQAPFDGGGIVGADGGIVAERRPEIVNSKWLVTRPTVVPPGTRVTSGARTARILRTRGTAGLRRYDAGGVVAGARSININVHTTAVANRYEFMRLLHRGGRDIQRMLGTRA